MEPRSSGVGRQYESGNFITSWSTCRPLKSIFPRSGSTFSQLMLVNIFPSGPGLPDHRWTTAPEAMRIHQMAPSSGLSGRSFPSHTSSVPAIFEILPEPSNTGQELGASPGSSSRSLLLLRLSLALCPNPGLEREHAGLTDLGITCIEGIQVARLNNGGQLHPPAGFPVVAGFPIGGADNDGEGSAVFWVLQVRQRITGRWHRGTGSVSHYKKGLALIDPGRYLQMHLLCSWGYGRRDVHREKDGALHGEGEGGRHTSFLAQENRAVVFAFASCEEVAELVEELNGPLEK